jgi:hypothetical protein
VEVNLMADGVSARAMDVDAARRLLRGLAAEVSGSAHGVLVPTAEDRETPDPDSDAAEGGRDGEGPDCAGGESSPAEPLV